MHWTIPLYCWTAVSLQVSLISSVKPLVVIQNYQYFHICQGQSVKPEQYRGGSCFPTSSDSWYPESYLAQTVFTLTATKIARNGGAVSSEMFIWCDFPMLAILSRRVGGSSIIGASGSSGHPEHCCPFLLLILGD